MLDFTEILKNKNNSTQYFSTWATCFKSELIRCYLHCCFAYPNFFKKQKSVSRSLQVDKLLNPNYMFTQCPLDLGRTVPTGASQPYRLPFNHIPSTGRCISCFWQNTDAVICTLYCMPVSSCSKHGASQTTDDCRQSSILLTLERMWNLPRSPTFLHLLHFY